MRGLYTCIQLSIIFESHFMSDEHGSKTNSALKCLLLYKMYLRRCSRQPKHKLFQAIDFYPADGRAECHFCIGRSAWEVCKKVSSGLSGILPTLLHPSIAIKTPKLNVQYYQRQIS